MPFVFGRKVSVARKVIRQKPHAAFHGHQVRPVGKKLLFGLRNAVFHRPAVALGVCFKQPDVEMHPGKVLFVLGRRGGPETNGIPEIVQHGAGHDRVEIDDGARPIGFRVHQDIVELGIVVRHP